MEFHTKEIETKYNNYKRKRIQKANGILFHILVWCLFTALMAYQQFVGIKGVQIGIHTDFYNSSERMFYELPLLWLTLILIQLLFHYAEYIPFLSIWQDRIERKEFNRLKNTYEYQLKLKDETTPNYNY